MAAAGAFARGFRRVPWARVLWVAREAGKRGSAVWRALGETDRKRFVELVRKSRGRPDKNLSVREFNELRSLATRAFNAARRPDSV